MPKYNLPVDYTKLSTLQRRQVRLQYIEEQKGLCWCCETPLTGPPPEAVLAFKINWKLFPKNFLKYPIHLQHNHTTGMTEGAVHAYCNALLWEYHGR